MRLLFEGGHYKRAAINRGNRDYLSNSLTNGLVNDVHSFLHRITSMYIAVGLKEINLGM